MMKYVRTKFVFGTHAVKRLMKRKVPLDAIVQIAEFGVTVQTTGERTMRRGEVNGEAIHVVVEHPNVIVTVYFADEWTSTVTVERVGRKNQVAVI